MSRQGFTLFEFLLVVVLLLVVAGVTVPQYYYVEAESKEAALITDLDAIRTAIEEYRKDHANELPGQLDGKPNEGVFRRQLTERSNLAGEMDPQGPYGPYLITGIPANPFNGLDTIKMLEEGDSLVIEGTTGWIYKASTGEFHANCPDTGPHGTPLSEL